MHADTLAPRHDADTPRADHSPTQGERFRWVEIFRGLAILEVVFHHASGRYLRVLDPEGGAWLALAILNRTLHYAVPAFLMMTAFVLMRSLLREFNLKRYAANRLLRALLPYLLWSGLYLVYCTYLLSAPPSWLRWADYLFWGKAYFHLYFLAVAMQLYVLLPLLLPVARRRPPFWAVLIAIVALTMAVYGFNRLVYRMPYTGSYVLWYTPVVLLGLWLATQAHRLGAVMRKGWLLALASAGVGLWLYLPLALQAIRGASVNTFHYQVGNWLFTAGVSFLLLAVAYWLNGSQARAAAGVQMLGRYSLQIYLIHPLVLSEWNRWGLVGALQARWGVLLCFLAALLIPFALGWLIARAPRASTLIFGRS
ncbi:MAG: acyltransferase [Fimbriimonadales bacterium]